MENLKTNQETTTYQMTYCEMCQQVFKGKKRYRSLEKHLRAHAQGNLLTSQQRARGCDLLELVEVKLTDKQVKFYVQKQKQRDKEEKKKIKITANTQLSKEH